MSFLHKLIISPFSSLLSLFTSRPDRITSFTNRLKSKKYLYQRLELSLHRYRSRAARASSLAVYSSYLSFVPFALSLYNFYLYQRPVSLIFIPLYALFLLAARLYASFLNYKISRTSSSIKSLKKDTATEARELLNLTKYQEIREALKQALQVDDKIDDLSDIKAYKQKTTQTLQEGGSVRMGRILASSFDEEKYFALVCGKCGFHNGYVSENVYRNCVFECKRCRKKSRERV